MASLRPHRVMFAVLAAVSLMSLGVTTADARVPQATPYLAGGPITLDTNLLSVSGVSAWAIDEYLKAKTPLPPLGGAFISAEQKYGTNARFLLAAALHESGWGTSYISRVKHNLFGYNAYDRDPSRYASAYATYAANIDATAKFIKDWYLTPGGRWWSGQPTLRSIQQSWSSSHTWGVNVSRIVTSIHLGSLAGRAITFAAPVVSGRVQGGDQAVVDLTWVGGSIPPGVEFLATWDPIELLPDVRATTGSRIATGDPATAGLAASPAVSASPSAGGPTPYLPDERGQAGVAARRVATSTTSITVEVAAPSAPGRYRLVVEMRDAGGGLLPAAEQSDIPIVEVRVWGDRPVSHDLAPSLRGSVVVVQISNSVSTPSVAVSSAISAG